MTVEIIDTGFTILAASKMLLLLLLSPEKMILSSNTKEEVDGLVDMIEDIKFKKDARALITWIINDEFKSETLNKASNQYYLTKLKKVKNEFLEFYLKTLNDISKGSNAFSRVCDVFTETNNFALKLMRLRLVIQPEIQIAKNVHTQSKISYIAAKGFWLDADGERIRKFTKSLGRLEDYKKGVKDPRAMQEAEIKIQEQMYKTYLEDYPD